MKTLLKITLSVCVLSLLISCNQKDSNDQMEEQNAHKELEKKILATNDSRYKAWNTGDRDLIISN